MAPLSRPFDTFNIDRTRSGNYKVTQFIPLETEINRYIENIDIIVIDLNSINMFLKYNWLIKHNSEVNRNKGII